VLLGIRWGNLRTKIIAWSFFPTMIILVVVAVVIFYAYQQVTEDLAIERNQELTLLTASQFAAELKEFADLLDAEARTSDVYGNDPIAQRDGLKGARNRLAVFDAGVLILDTFGTVVAAEPERPEILGENWSDHTYYRQMLRSQILGSSGPVFSDIVTDGPGGAEVIVVAVPITGPQGEFVGTIAGMFHVGATTVSAFYGDMVKLRLGESGSAYLVDGNGRMIYHSAPDRIGDDVSTQGIVRQVLSGEVGAVRTRDFEGRDIVASFAPVPGTSWGLVTQESWAALISSSQDYRRVLLLLLALGVVVPVLVVTVGVRRITKPIGDLIGAAQEVARGNFGQKITARTGDEIEDLAEQFNLMSVQLQESYAHLERRVADRTKELAALNAIATVVSRSLDLEEILNDALDKTLQVMEIEAGGIYLLDEEAGVLTVTAQRGFSPQAVAEIDGLKVGEGFSGRVAQSGQPLVVKNVSADPRLTRMVVREEGFRSLAIVPVSSKGNVLGTLFAMTHGYREFTDQDVQLLTSIGHQIGVAIENARLFEAESEQRQEATLLVEMAKLISGTLDLDEVLRLTAEYAVDVFDIHCCCIFLYDEGKGTLRPAVKIGFDDQVAATITEVEFFPSEGMRRMIFEGRQPLIVEDVPSDPHLSPQDLLDLQSALVVPIEVGGRRLGALQLGTQRPRRRRFTADEGELALAMANQAAMAIENARLFDAEQRRAEQFRVISEVSRRTTSILAVDELLDQVVELIQGAFNYYLVEIGLVEENEVVFRARAGRDWGSQFESFRLRIGEEGITGWVAAAGEPLLVPDVSQEPRYVKVTDTETRSELAVPIKTKEKVIGVINVESDRLDAFDVSDLAVLQSLAHQAAIAIENARLFAERERRIDEMAVLNEVGWAISSTLRLDELLSLIHHQVGRVMDATNLYIALYHRDEDRVSFPLYVEGDRIRWDTYGRKAGRGLTEYIIRNRQPVLLSDNVEGRAQELGIESIGTPAKSWLGVPMIAGDEVLGVIAVQSYTTEDVYDEEHLNLLSTISAQAAIAIENARLFKAERRRTEEFRVISEVGRRMTSILAADELLWEIARLLKESLGYYLVGIALIEGDELIFRAGAGAVWETPGFEPPRLKVGQEGITGWVAQSGEPLLVPDVSQEPWYYSLPQASEIRSELAVPLRTKEAVIGVLHVQSDHLNAFDESDQAVLQSLAHQAAIAIENARLYEQAQQVATLEERQRLARELHDSVTQALYGVTLYAEAAARLLSSGDVDMAADHLRELQDTAQEALREMRLLIFELRPPVLQRQGLVTALQVRLEAVEERAGLETEFKVEGESRLPLEVEEELYRIAQEALNNALKHAQARRITVTLRQVQGTVTLEIADDGIGFDPSTALEYGGLGLEGMEERAAQLGARLTVQSRLGEGTRVRVEVSQ
jgi:GAF domain-containing protein/HAMP domain-containing protein